MMRIITTLFLILAFALGVQAQNQGRWATARERGLKGTVHIVVSSCSDIKGNYEARYRYEYARGGELNLLTSPQIKLPECIISVPMSHKITKRNSRGDIEEVSYFLEGDLLEKERYEYEYDSMGNWVKAVTYLMRTYEMEGGDWKEGEWQARYVCTRTIEYYP